MTTTYQQHNIYNKLFYRTKLQLDKKCANAFTHHFPLYNPKHNRCKKKIHAIKHTVIKACVSSTAGKLLALRSLSASSSLGIDEYPFVGMLLLACTASSISLSFSLSVSVVVVVVGIGVFGDIVVVPTSGSL